MIAWGFHELAKVFVLLASSGTMRARGHSNHANGALLILHPLQSLARPLLLVLKVDCLLILRKIRATRPVGFLLEVPLVSVEVSVA